MTPRAQLLSHADYVQVLKSHLPPQAFRPRPRKLWAILAHLIVIATSYAAFRFTSSILAYFLLSLVIGHSLMCLVFLAHELSHNTIIRRPSVQYPLEVLLWGLNLIPATMWRRLHNQSHHIYGNTLRDPDRFFLKSELEAPEGRLRRWYTNLFFPHRFTPKWNPLVGFHFVTYVVRHLLAVFYPRDRRPTVVTYKPAYTGKLRLRIVGEVMAIACLQYGIFLAAGETWAAFAWASPIAILFTSTFAMTYIWTNHYLHGLHEIHDPVASSTSVEVPLLFDWLHSNFSYHTEHHLFPNVNGDFYPLVSQLLTRFYPTRYHRLPMSEAWRLLWKGEQYIRTDQAHLNEYELPPAAEAGSEHEREVGGQGSEVGDRRSEVGSWKSDLRPPTSDSCLPPPASSRSLDIQERSLLTPVFHEESIDARVLDSTLQRFQQGEVEEGMVELLPVLQARRIKSSEAEWASYARACLRHPLRALLHQDPFTGRAFSKPRGYAGDAVLLDFVYGHEEGWRAPEGASELGKKIFQFTTASSACEAVRARRGFIADLVDALAADVGKPDILSVASGHLREALLCSTIKRRRFSRYLALDSDPQSLEEVSRCYGGYGVQTCNASVRRLLGQRHDLGRFDLIYSMGLYDYLQMPAAQRLTAALFHLLRPRGRLLIANFLPGILDVGYMESFMDWKLIFRTRQEMLAIAEEVPLADIRDIRIFAEDNQNIIFLQITRR